MKKIYLPVFAALLFIQTNVQAMKRNNNLYNGEISLKTYYDEKTQEKVTLASCKKSFWVTGEEYELKIMKNKEGITRETKVTKKFAYLPRGAISSHQMKLIARNKLQGEKFWYPKPELPEDIEKALKDAISKQGM